ncbi:DUF687 domain-containing protein [Candidatus Woesearchaeota archaeon]|nr:DUF687 domain-containing protein [Candidatus Woesearchaeota archaeon]
MAKTIKEEVFNHHPKMGMGKKILLILPALLSVSWIFYLGYNPSPYYGAELLSPSKTAPLIIALAIFTVGYIIFLMFMFSEDIRDMFRGEKGY